MMSGRFVGAIARTPHHRSINYVRVRNSKIYE